MTCGRLMKLAVLAFLALILFRADGCPACRAEDPAESRQEETAGRFVLPASLQTIEEDAFAGTAAVQVEMPETVETVGDRAFADMSALRSVYIPAGVTRIGEGVFDGTAGVVVEGQSGSYAEQWAAQNGFFFAVRQTLPARAQGVSPWAAARQLAELFLLIALGLILKAENRRKPACRKVGQGRTMRWNERPERHAQDGYFP